MMFICQDHNKKVPNFGIIWLRLLIIKVGDTYKKRKNKDKENIEEEAEMEKNLGKQPAIDKLIEKSVRGI